MNSWKSIGLSACAPPLTMFIIGTGSTPRLRPADIAIERQRRSLGRGLRDGERDAEDGVGAETRLVRRAVEIDHRLVDGDLVLRLHAADMIEDLAVDRRDGLGDALAQELAICRRRAARPPRARRSRRPTAPRRGPSSRPRASRRPRPSDCPGCRGSGGRRYRRSRSCAGSGRAAWAGNGAAYRLNCFNGQGNALIWQCHSGARRAAARSRNP